ncbi:MAG: hypothetical protein K2X03_31405 [Bryobacteraceae bacterium]|nr:hypothetical protein [Bryobacteraceae bacterium]
MRRILLVILGSTLVWGQPTVAPTNEAVGPPRGLNYEGYNILQNFETGFRFFDVDGNLGKYRSDVNYRRGMRLLSSGLTINSREGKGRLFDEILLNTQGLGNDPYQSAILRVQKNKLYRYDLIWRTNDYFNPALTISNGQHLLNTRRQWQDQTLTLLPGGNFQFFVGYGRNSQSGAGLSTVQLFDSRGNDFAYFSDLRRQQNEFRVGGEVKVTALKFLWQRGWEWFKDDPREFLTGPSAGNDPNNSTRLNSFNRAEPWRGQNPSWRANLFTEGKRWWALNGRFSYVEGRRNFILDESAIGTARFGALQNRQYLLFGTGRRPVLAANVTGSIFPTERLSISQHLAFHNTKMEGDASYREFNNSTLQLSNFNFNFLGVRAFTSTTDVNYRVTKRLGLFGGYQFTERTIRSVEQLSDEFFKDQVAAEQTNRLHTGLAGIRFQPIKPLQINLDGELGRADRPIYGLSERNFHSLGARVQWKHKSLMISAQARNRYNFNSASLWSHSSKGRNYGANATWTPVERFSLDAGYAKIHLDTLTGLAYFANGASVTNDRSRYVSNIHAVHFLGRLMVAKKVDVSAGYSRNQDLGDGRNTVTGSSLTGIPGFLQAQTFPLSFTSPQARISWHFHPKVRANFGYQYYTYQERFFTQQNYRANTGFVSLLWAF